MAQPATWDWSIGGTGGSEEYVRDMAVDTVNNWVYAIGTYDHAGFMGLPAPSGSSDAFICKRDLNGTSIWATRIGGFGADGGNGLAIGGNGNIYVTGSLPVSSGGTDLFVACLNSAGALQWIRSGGGSSNDAGYGIAVNNTGVFVQGVYNGLANFGFTGSATALNNSHDHACVLKYSHAGTLLWQLNGGSGPGGNRDVNPERIACDENGAYVTGTFQYTSIDWYSGPTLVQTINATGLNANIYTASISNAGAFNWVRSVSNPGDIDINSNAIAVGCGAVYFAGRTHNGSTFPSGNVVNITGGPHDHLYLIALNKTTGSQLWSRTAHGPDNHLTDGYDLTVNATGSVYLTGQFKGSMTFSDGTVISTTGGGGYELDAFVARYSAYGMMDWAIMADGSKNDIPMAIGVDDLSGVHVGGQFDEELRLTPSALTLTDPNSNKKNPFVAKFTDPQRPSWPLNPSNWVAPASICSYASAINLNALLPGTNRGAASSVVGRSGMTATDAARMLGMPDGISCPYTANGWSATLDLGDTIPSGGKVGIVWGKMAAIAGMASFVLEASADNVTYTVLGAPAITAAASALVESMVVTNVNTRYLRITRNDAVSPIDFKVDGIKYFIATLGGGTWSGAGVSGNLFNPNGQSGSVAITYTVANGSCAYSTTKAVQVITVSGGTLTAPGTICPQAPLWRTSRPPVKCSSVHPPDHAKRGRTRSPSSRSMEYRPRSPARRTSV